MAGWLVQTSEGGRPVTVVMGKRAFEFPCDPLAERERQLSGKPQGVSLVTQFFMRV